MKKKAVLACVCIPLLVIAVFAGNFAYRIHWYQSMNPEGRYFDSDGIRLHYSITGSGVPLILVHGFGVNGGFEFRARGVLDLLAAKYRVITLDNRGHGRSDKPHDPGQYGVKMCEDVIRLMDHLQIDKAHILGYSMGGFIVLKLATLYPERFFSFAPCGSGWTPEPEKELAFFRKLADDLEQGRGYGALSDRLTPLGGKVSRYDRFMLSAGLSALNDEEALAAMLRGMSDLMVPESALKANKLPGLAIVGERDPLRPLAEKMAAVTPNMQLVITPDADHMSTLRRPQTKEAIESFLREHSPPSGTAHAIDAGDRSWTLNGRDKNSILYTEEAASG